MSEEEPGETSSPESPQADGFEDELSALVSDSTQEGTTPTADTDILEELSDFYKSEEKCGPALSDKLAGIVHSALRVSFASEKYDHLLGKYHRPQNCADMTTPRV